MYGYIPELKIVGFLGGVRGGGGGKVMEMYTNLLLSLFFH